MYEIIIINKTTSTCYLNSNSKLMANNLNGKRMVFSTKIDYFMFKYSKDNVSKERNFLGFNVYITGVSACLFA